MSKSSNKKVIKPYLYGLLALWFIGCLLQYLFCCRNHADAVTAVPATQTALSEQITSETVSLPGFELLDSSGEVQLSAADNITFAKSKPQMNSVSDKLKTILSQLPNNIPDNKALVITGLYDDSEVTSNTDNTSDNLGQQRAKNVAEWLRKHQSLPDGTVIRDKQLTQLVGSDTARVATVFSVEKRPQAKANTTPESSKKAAITDNKAIETKANRPVKSVVVSSITASSHPFSLKSDELNLHSDNNFNFISGDHIPAQPIAEALDKNVLQTINYLKSEPTRQITITGRYHPDEHNGSAFPDLGLARAKQIKDYMVALGANGQQITLASSPYPEAIANSRRQYLGMADFKLSVLNEDDIQARSLIVQQLADEIQATPLTLYFDTGVSEITLSTEQRQLVLKLAQYLDVNPKAKVTVTGHTDNIGNGETNIRLGRERAEFAANYLAKNGLKSTQMVVHSAGPNQPIADNSSEEGRRKNRRVTITIEENTP